ncbi:MAG: hypothetical protein HWN67_09360 [Candidatus Helarchaeota archaeon]|nr:hypothetical protein [Candidatus Helarchaeota archaeon]
MMTCPICGVPTPGESYCSVECMKIAKEKEAKGLESEDAEEKELDRKYELLPILTEKWTVCPFHKVKLKLGKEKLIKEDEDDEDTYYYERTKYCPRCYRVFCYLFKEYGLEDAEWELEAPYFEETVDLLVELDPIIKEYDRKKKGIYSFE